MEAANLASIYPLLKNVQTSIRSRQTPSESKWTDLGLQIFSRFHISVITKTGVTSPVLYSPGHEY